MRREKPGSSQQGQALVLVLLLTICIIIVAYGFASLYTARARLNGTNVRQYTAEYVADTGVYKFLWGLNQNVNFFQQNIATYSAYYPEEENGVGGYYYITEQNNASGGASPTIATLTCTGWLADDPNHPYTVQATLKKRAFTDNIYFSNVETDAARDIVNFTTGDTINGNLSTNGTIYIDGNPVFNGLVQYAGNPPVLTGGSTPTYNDGPPQKVNTLPLPATDAQLAQYAKTGGIYLMGRTCIFINGGNLTYVNYDENPSDPLSMQGHFVTKTVSIAITPSFNGVIYVDNANGDTGDSQNELLSAAAYPPGGVYNGYQYDNKQKFILTRGNIFISSYDHTGLATGLGQGMSSTIGAHLTIAAANNIYITPVDPTYQYTGGSPYGTYGTTLYTNITSSSNSYGITYGRTTFTGQTANTTAGDDMLGLIANNDIMILQSGWPQQNATSPYVNINTNYSPNNVNVYAAVMSNSYSFMFEEYWNNINNGNINLEGSVIQQYRGPVGLITGGHYNYGYSKNYYYDSRMSYETPPYFLNPANIGWGVMYWQRGINIPAAQFPTLTGMTIAGWNATSGVATSGVLINGTLPIVVESVNPPTALNNQSVTWSINPNGTNASIDPYGGTWNNNGIGPTLPSSTLTAGTTAGTVTVYATPTVQYQSTNPYVSTWSANIAITSH
jgi:hypothetical protein